MSDEPEFPISDLAALRLLMRHTPNPTQEAQRIRDTILRLTLTDPEFAHLVHVARSIARTPDSQGESLMVPDEPAGIGLIALGVYVARQYHRGEAL